MMNGIEMVVDEIRAEIEEIESDASLYEEINFERRVEAVDALEFRVIERIETLLPAAERPEELMRLKLYAEQVKEQLAAIDDALFQRLRADVRAGICTGAVLRGVIEEYAGGESGQGREQKEVGYDALDVFMKGLLNIYVVPVETREREPEMVAWQPTPARVILELVDMALLSAEDVFYDLGSGLGQVPIMVNLLSGANAKGVEIEPAFCDYARACAASLNLSRVEFINADARNVTYADGTVFFMYTPFEGRILDQVLGKLREDTRERSMRLLTYGPCTRQVAEQSWLKRVEQGGRVFLFEAASYMPD